MLSCGPNLPGLATLARAQHCPPKPSRESAPSRRLYQCTARRAGRRWSGTGWRSGRRAGRRWSGTGWRSRWRFEWSQSGNKSIFLVFCRFHMACLACQRRRSSLQGFYQLTDASVLTILANNVSSSCYKWVFVDQSRPFHFRDVGGCTFYCTPLEEMLKVCCRIKALNKTWMTRTFYISHSVVIPVLEAHWLPA